MIQLLRRILGIAAPISHMPVGHASWVLEFHNPNFPTLGWVRAPMSNEGSMLHATKLRDLLFFDRTVRRCNSYRLHNLKTNAIVLL